jgi:NADPH2:quinone reductase
VRQTRAGLNFVDVYQRSGLYPVAWPAVLGQEGVGVVESVGPGVTGWGVGDRVGYVGLLGAYATARLTPAERLIPLPASVSDDDAAALLFKGITAEMLVRRTYPVTEGEVVLVHAAAGGVGQLLCRWASHLGATVLGVVGSARKAALAREAGCAEVFVTPDQDFVEGTLRHSGGRGADVVYESIGGETFRRSFDALRTRGTLVSFGQAGGEVPSLSLNLLGRGSYRLTRPSIRHYTAAPEELRASSAGVFELIEQGVLRANIGQRWPLTQLPDAHRALEARQTVGATIFTVDESDRGTVLFS